MKRKNGFSMILIIPAIVLVLFVGGVFLYKLYSDGQRTKAVEEVIPKTPLTLPASTGKPAAGYGSLSIPSPSPAAASNSSDLDTLLTNDEDPDYSDIDTALNQL